MHDAGLEVQKGGQRGQQEVATVFYSPRSHIMVTQDHVLLLVRYSRARCSRLDNYQEVPYGTNAWSKSYGRRSSIELLNKLLKIDKGLSNNAFLCAFGLGSHELAAIMLCVAHNIEVATRYVEDQTAVERGDEELPPCDEIVSLPDDTYFSGRQPEMTQEPPGGQPPS